MRILFVACILALLGAKDSSTEVSSPIADLQKARGRLANAQAALKAAEEAVSEASKEVKEKEQVVGSLIKDMETDLSALKDALAGAEEPRRVAPKRPIFKKKAPVEKNDKSAKETIKKELATLTKQEEKRAQEMALRRRGLQDNGKEQQQSNLAKLRLKVPKNAVIWINGMKQKTKGRVREFHADYIKTGKKYKYQVKMRYGWNRRRIARRKIVLSAGQTKTVTMP